MPLGANEGKGNIFLGLGYDMIYYEKSFFLAAATLKFTGTESMSMRFSESIISEADNLRLRFRTVIFSKL